MAHVTRNFERPSKRSIELMSQYSPATIHEAQGKRGALDYQIKPIKPGLKLCGPAITAQCHIGDNLMIFQAIELAQPGDVLVLSAGNNPSQGGFGDVLAAACIGRGIAGLVIDASVRDGAGLRSIGFPVFSLGLCIKGTSKDTLGTINQPIMVGGEYIRPGDIICGDDDGVVVVREDDVETFAKTCQARDDAENKLIEQHRKGQLDFQERHEMMASKGCIWED